MNQIIRILLVDDQSLFREALQTLLVMQTDFLVVGQASNGEEALRTAIHCQPDLVLMDLRMPVMDGVSATQRFKSSFPLVKVIALTTFDDDELVFDAIRAGAVGYLLKDVSPEKLYEAIRATARGEYFLHPTITAKVISEFARIPRPRNGQMGQQELISPLSSREIEILKIAATGASNRDIADHLVIAEGTVKNHMRNILGKMDVKDRMQAVLKAKELGII